jgi:hypothetical protein
VTRTGYRRDSGGTQRIDRLRDALARDESPPEVLEAAGKRALWVFEAMEYCAASLWDSGRYRFVCRQHGA